MSCYSKYEFSSYLYKLTKAAFTLNLLIGPMEAKVSASELTTVSSPTARTSFTLSEQICSDFSSQLITILQYESEGVTPLVSITVSNNGENIWSSCRA